MMKNFQALLLMLIGLLAFVACAPTNAAAPPIQTPTAPPTPKPTLTPSAEATAVLAPEELVEAMFDAVRQDNVALAKQYIEAGVDVNTPGDMRVTLLEIAAHRGNIDMLQTLIDAGATYQKNVFLASLRDSADDPTIVQIFIDAGADVNEAEAGAPGHSPLMYAAEGNNVEIGRALLAKGADIHQIDAYNDPAINVAAFHNSMAFAEMLVEMGADPNVPGYYGRTAVGHAKNQGHQEMVDYLLSIGATE
jgi:ankyrin repeat protein